MLYKKVLNGGEQTPPPDWTTSKTTEGDDNDDDDDDDNTSCEADEICMTNGANADPNDCSKYFSVYM